MRVLIISSYCNPEWPSLPSFAYEYAKELANHAEVVVATQIRNGQAIKKSGCGKAEVVFINSERIESPLHKLSVGLRGGVDRSWNVQLVFSYFSYLAFEWYVWRRFRGALLNGEFDVVHRLTPVSLAAPSYIARRCPVPFVVGPVNGGLPWPSETRLTKSREMNRLDKAAELLLKAHRLFPYCKSTYTRSSAILACFEHTCASLPSGLRSKTINFPEVGLDPNRFHFSARAPREKLTVLFVGRLVPLKRVEVLVQAFGDSQVLRRHKLLIVGEGPERSNLEALVENRGLTDCVELVGQKPWPEVAQLMRQSDLFAFPSVHEQGGGVVVEAMACGLACVVVDYGGPATLVREDYGIKIPLRSSEQLQRDFQAELEKLVCDQDRVRNLGRAASEHAARYYTWEAKARKTVEIYRWTMGELKRMPDYWESPSL